MTTFNPNRAGIEALATGPEMTAVMRAKADAVKAIAEGLAEEFRVSGDYADSFEVTTETDTEFGRGPRASGIVTNHSGHAAAVEWGNTGVVVYLDRGTRRFVSADHASDPGVERLVVDFPAHHVLKKALEALG